MNTIQENVIRINQKKLIKEFNMKLFLLFTILIFALTNAHEYTVYDMNGKIQGSFNGELNKYIISDFAKKNHSSILVQKGTINKSSTLQNIIQYNPSSVLKNYTERDIDISLDSLGKELWIEVEKNEIIKICFDRRIQAWETSLNAQIFDDLCLVFQAPTFIGVDTLKAYFFRKSEPTLINMAGGLKYLNLKKEEVLLGFHEYDLSHALLGMPQEDPERLASITATYLVDKYPVTNCEFLQLMWDSIPEKSSYAHAGAKKAQEAWFARKKNSIRNKNCVAHDSAASTIFLYQAMKYANARSIREGLTPYYIFSPTDSNESIILSKGKYIIGYYDFSEHESEMIQVSVNNSSNGYRLPYYHEWMILARGGDKKNRVPWGDEMAPIDSVQKYARFSKTNNYFNSAAIVGQLRPNGYGLYDVFGLVGEHVLFEEHNPFKNFEGTPSCLKGGDRNVRTNEDEKRISMYPLWFYINYGYSEYNGSGFARGGFRLIRNIGNNVKWSEVKSK